MSGVEIETVSLVEGAADRALWRAVIANAITDACYRGKSLYQCADRTRAIEWFTKPNRDFAYVCNLAGLEADQVRRFAAQRINITPGVVENFAKTPTDRRLSVAEETT